MSKDSNKMPSLQPKYVFGIRSDIYQNINFFFHDKVAYIAGNYIVICLIKEKTQFFIPANPELGEITSFTIDEYKEQIWLLIGQKGERGEKAIINFKFLNKVDYSKEDQRPKKIGIEDMESSDSFQSLGVNISRGMIAALLGPKNAAVAIFLHDSRGGTKPHSITKLTLAIPYKFLTINPENPNFISVLGDGGIVVCLMNETEKKLPPAKIEIEPKSPGYTEFQNLIFNFVSCYWISKTRIACLNIGCDVVIIDFVKKFETPLKKVLKGVHIFEGQSKGKAIFSRNFMLYVARDDGLIVKLQDKLSEKGIQYEKKSDAKFVQNIPKMDVHMISLNTSLGAIVISTENGQIYFVDINGENSLSDGNNYKYFISPFHSEDITCLDVAKLKPLVCTGSRDRYIRIWNYISLQQENYEMFDDEPTYIAFHPNGLHLAVLFKEKMRFMHILEKKIYTYKEFGLNMPCDVKFSNFGHYISVLSRNIFYIYNFYTCELVWGNRISDGHTEDISNLVWDNDDTGFATCGYDGKSYYWQLYEQGNRLVEFSNKDYKFVNCDIIPLPQQPNSQLQDEPRKMIVADYNTIYELAGNYKDRNENKYSEKKDTLKILMKEKIRDEEKSSTMCYSQLIYNMDAKLIVVGLKKDHAPSIRIARYAVNLSQKNKSGEEEKKEKQTVSPLINTADIREYQANSLGVSSLRISQDISHLFTCGKDRCLFLFQFQGLQKQDKRDETLESDLLLVDKGDMDTKADELRKKINKIEEEMKKEEDLFKSNKLMLELDKTEVQQNFDKELKRYKEEQQILDKKIATQTEYYAGELLKAQTEYTAKMDEMIAEQKVSLELKEQDRKREADNFEKEKKRDADALITLNRKIQAEEKELIEKYDQQIKDIELEIKDLITVQENIMKEISIKKEEKIETNDTKIAKKREELEKLKRDYEEADKKFEKEKKELKQQIDGKKDAIRTLEQKKFEERKKLTTIQEENERYARQIKDFIEDKKEKLATIEEKNNIKRELENENQELDKFKFVLNYKIKELKHERDPKENKLQALEKQTKDMDREIKNFEGAQATYIINLSSNKETMNLYERQIARTEKAIEQNKSYKRAFQDALFRAVNVNTNKELKKELIRLKRVFLDKEELEAKDKPNEMNYDNRRQFLENNIEEQKNKLKNAQNLFFKDHEKLMFENMNLIKIVNELEKDKKEIEGISIEQFINPDKSSLKGSGLPKKPELPKIGGFNSHDNRVRSLREKLMEYEKEIQSIVMANKKKEKEDKIKELKEKKKLRSSSQNPDS